MLNFEASKPRVKGDLPPPPEPHLLLCVWVGGVRGGGEVNRPAVSQRYFEFNHTHGHPKFADILYCLSVYSHE